MLATVMRLEQRVASPTFNQDASKTPEINRMTPPYAQNDLWRPVVSRGDDGRVVFVVEGSGAEVDEVDLRREQDPSKLRRSCRKVAVA